MKTTTHTQQSFTLKFSWQIKKIAMLAAIIFSCSCIFGCVSINNKYIAQQQYVLIPAKVKNISSRNSNKILDVYYPQIAQQFAAANFVYRTSELKYTSDYYNRFAVSPAEQIHKSLIKYLENSNLFKYASDDIYPLQADYILKAKITEIYADYQNSQNPTAVITLQFALLDNNASLTRDKQPITAPQIILNKTFSESIPLSQKSSDALIMAWSKGLQNILDEFTAAVASKIQGAKI